MTARVEQLQVEKILPLLDSPPFNSQDVKEKILSLLPEFTRERVSFALKGVNPSIANALRRVVLSELRAKALDFDLGDVKTNSKEVILEDLRNRINFIPLDQRVHSDARFSLQAVNNTSSTHYEVVKSKNLLQVHGPTLPTPAFSSTHRLVELGASKFLSVSNVKVVEGTGEQHAMFSLTCDFEFQVRDFLSVSFLNAHGNIVNRMVKREELKKLMESFHQPWPEEAEDYTQLFKPRILVIPNPDYQKLLDRKTTIRVKSFPVILENPSPASQGLSLPEQENSFLREYTSSECTPRDYYLSFRTSGNVDPLLMLQQACENLIERLEGIKTPDESLVQRDEEKTRISLKGEMYTMKELLTRTIFELDPGIGLVNSSIKHAQIRVCSINLIHPEPLMIFKNACEKLISLFQDLKQQFSEEKKKKKT